MKICNVQEIYDNGEFITITTDSGSVIHLPEGRHSIVIDNNSRQDTVHIIIDLFEG